MIEPYQLLPNLNAEDYARLREDIRERGVMVPIEVDETGAILDGHHRKKIADELGIDCPRVTRINMADHEKRIHAVALNVSRRHLTDAQKALIGRQIEPDIAEAARRRQAIMNGRSVVELPDKCPEAGTETRDEVARKVGLGAGRTYERHRKALDEAEIVAPQIVEKARAGEATMKDVRREVSQARKAERVARIGQKPVVPASGLFHVICADPPWRYEHAPHDTRAIENHYPTMTTDAICELPCPAEDDAVLFLWATNPKLLEALRVMAAWGFDYRTNIVWVKDRPGIGYYARGQHELLLIGRRGKFPRPAPEDTPASVITASRAAHSEKPAEAYALIERMYPEHARLEMFARTSRPGWEAWGNQASAA